MFQKSCASVRVVDVGFVGVGVVLAFAEDNVTAEFAEKLKVDREFRLTAIFLVVPTRAAAALEYDAAANQPTRLHCERSSDCAASNKS